MNNKPMNHGHPNPGNHNPGNPSIPNNPGSDSDMKYSDLTHKIIGCAMEVHSILGNGFQEVIYQRALAIEMEKAEIIFSREAEMSIYYKDVAIGTRRVDF